MEKVLMSYSDAEKLCKIGECIALPEWEGFWFTNIKTEKLLVLTKEGLILDTPIEEFKLRNDWKVVDPTEKQTLILENYFSTI